MSGQSTSPNGSFSNVAAGCSLRESSQRDRPRDQEAGGHGNNSNSNNGESSSSAPSRARAGMMFVDAGPPGGAAADESDVEMMDDDHPRNHRPRDDRVGRPSQAGDDSSQGIPAFGAGGPVHGGRPPQAAAPAAPPHAAGDTSGGIPTGQFSYDRGQYLRRPREFSTSPGPPGAAAGSPSYCPGELTVYSWGRGEDGQLGIGDTSDQDTPTYVDSLRGVGVKQIACGSGHTVVLTGEGEVYTWGRGDDGRLGHGDNGWKYVPRLTHSLAGQVITHVTCGSYHTAAVSSKGNLFTWGGGMYGKLGHGNESGHSTPKRVDSLVGLAVVDIACGSRHTAIVTSRGCLYTWGDKENGVAGHGDTEGHQYTPKLLERLSGKRVVQLSACGFHTGCLTDAGEVYTWGEGKFGRLGHGAERNCHSPRLVETLLGKRPVQISCGGFHSAVVTADGKMYTFGGGEHGQLGHGDKVNKVKPTLVKDLDGVFLTQITCGWSHSVALTSSHEVYTWGNGDHGKLGHGCGKKVSTPQLVEKLVGQKVVCVASYNEHTACLVEPHSVNASRRHAPGTMVQIGAGYLHDMKELVNDEEFSDVTFIVENRPVHALRAILAKRCEHFSAMFRSGMRESEAGVEIPIPNLSYPVFLLIMEYLYTDAVKIEVEHAVELYIAADLYQLSTLREMCCVVVKRNISAENAAYMLQSAHENCCQSMKDIAMAYIVDHFDIVSKSEGIKAISHGLLLEILSLRP
mmetsp:Transcript_18551/g.43383  ORF Transcript_18551/g.43383 Transcript_18551/m.43383 type:complete len:740 (+) Transcript_18551:274-2493(+)